MRFRRREGRPHHGRSDSPVAEWRALRRGGMIPLQVGVNELAQTQTLATTLRGEFVFDGDGGEEAFGPRPIRGMSGYGMTACGSKADVGCTQVMPPVTG
jgi:hypothetical protein